MAETMKPASPPGLPASPLPAETFFLAALVESLGALAWLLLIPPDPKNAVLLGFSLQRWLLIGLMVAAGGICAFVLVKSRSQQLSTRLRGIFLSPVGLWVELGGVAAALAGILLVGRFAESALERILPLFAWMGLVSLTALVWQLIASGGGIWQQTFSGVRRTEQTATARTAGFFNRGAAWLSAHPQADLPIVLGLAAIPLLANAVRFSLPLGYAGLYTLMSEQVAQGGFALPWSVPFYGPGGIPFAYPPLAFYLMALFLRLGVPSLTYLRFAGPLLAWASLAPVTRLAKELTGSRLAAAAAVIILGVLDGFYIDQATAAGMVRSLALLFSALALLAYLRAVRQPGWKNAVLAGVFFALTICTHLSYAQFLAMTFVLYPLMGIFQLRRWTAALLAGVVGIILSAPWWGVVLARYGASVFSGALGSHENSYFIRLFQDPAQWGAWLNDLTRQLQAVPLLWALVVAGFLLNLLLGEPFLPAWLALVIVFNSSQRFPNLVGALLAGQLVARLFAWWKTADAKKAGAAIFVLLLAGALYLPGVSTLSSHQPMISTQTLELAGFVRQNTPPSATYLVTAPAEEAEWLPYLMQRTPAVGSWGGEWIGTYDAQVAQLLELMACEQNQSLACLNQVIQELKAAPALLITHTQTTQLTAQLEQAAGWRIVFQNDQYILWSR